MTTPVEILCKSLPIEIPAIINYIQSLGFEDKPDYYYIRKTLRTLFAKKDYI